MRRHQSLPRMPDLRRSFHGASHSFRESMRSIGSGSLGRSGYRDMSGSSSTKDSPTKNNTGSKGSIGDSFKRTSDSLRRSTGNLKDSMRERSHSFRDRIRTSFRRGSGERRTEQNGDNKIEVSPNASPATLPANANRANGTTTTV